jgi:hypothetical protein
MERWLVRANTAGEAAMRFKVQLVAVDGGEDAVVQELAILDKDCELLEQIGLTPPLPV